MCGIAGKDRPRRAPSTRRSCSGCARCIAHRGPDSRGTHLDAGVGLGIQRLAVIDLEHGDQPIYNEDRTRSSSSSTARSTTTSSCARNCARRGHRFAPESDTETIVHLYEEHGAGCVERLRGMFAFALWDRRAPAPAAGARPRRQEAALLSADARRRSGSAPSRERSSSIPRCRARSTPTALDALPALPVRAPPASAFAGLRKLPPGHVLVWEGGEPQISRYWSPQLRTPGRRHDGRGGEIVRDELLEATRLRLRSRRPARRLSLRRASTRAPSWRRWRRRARAGCKTFSIGFDVEQLRRDRVRPPGRRALRHRAPRVPRRRRRDRASFRGWSGTTASRSPTPRRSRASTSPS